MSLQEQLRFALGWLDCHVELSRQLGKPLVLSEFGKRRGGWPGAAAAGRGDEQRAEYYRQVRGPASLARRWEHFLLRRPGVHSDACQALSATPFHTLPQAPPPKRTALRANAGAGRRAAPHARGQRAGGLGVLDAGGPLLSRL